MGHRRANRAKKAWEAGRRKDRDVNEDDISLARLAPMMQRSNLQRQPPLPLPKAPRRAHPRLQDARETGPELNVASSSRNCRPSQTEMLSTWVSLYTSPSKASAAEFLAERAPQSGTDPAAALVSKEGGPNMIASASSSGHYTTSPNKPLMNQHTPQAFFYPCSAAQDPRNGDREIRNGRRQGGCKLEDQITHHGRYTPGHPNTHQDGNSSAVAMQFQDPRNVVGGSSITVSPTAVRSKALVKMISVNSSDAGAPPPVEGGRTVKEIVPKTRKKGANRSKANRPSAIQPISNEQRAHILAAKALKEKVSILAGQSRQATTSKAEDEYPLPRAVMKEIQTPCVTAAQTHSPALEQTPIRTIINRARKEKRGGRCRASPSQATPGVQPIVPRLEVVDLTQSERKTGCSANTRSTQPAVIQPVAPQPIAPQPQPIMLPRQQGIQPEFIISLQPVPSYIAIPNYPREAVMKLTGPMPPKTRINQHEDNGDGIKRRFGVVENGYIWHVRTGWLMHPSFYDDDFPLCQMTRICRHSRDCHEIRKRMAIWSCIQRGISFREAEHVWGISRSTVQRRTGGYRQKISVDFLLTPRNGQDK